MRETKAIVGTAVGLAALACLLLVVSRRSAAPRIEPIEAGESPAPATKPVLLETTEARVERSAMETAREEAAPRAPARASRSETPNVVRVLVLWEETRTPMPGHLVTWAPLRPRFQQQVLRQQGSEQEHELRADNQGIVYVPAQERGTVLWGASPEGFCILRIGPDEHDDLHELLVRPNEPLVVRTVGPEGELVPGVVLEAMVEDRRVMALSDESGRATIENARLLAALTMDGTLLVRLQHLQAHALLLDSRAWPAGEVELLVPALGGLSACVLGVVDGHHGYVRIVSVEDDEGEALVKSRFGFHGKTPCVEFRSLPVGRVFDVEIVGGELKRVEGPRVAGEVVRVELDALATEEAHPALVGELVSAEGAPLTNKGFWYEVKRAEGERLAAGNASTSEDGRFGIEVNCDDATFSPGERGRARLQVNNRGQALVEFALPLQRGPNDVGVIVLGESPLLATIVVRGEGGESIEIDDITAKAQDGLFGLDVRAIDAERYEVRGDVTEAFDLRIVAEGYLLHESRCPVGARDLEVVLARSVSLQGKLMLDPWIDIQCLSIRVPGRGKAARNRVEPHGSCGFRFGRLETHPSQLEVWVDDEGGNPLLVQPLVAGVDPVIDLRGRLHGFQIQVRDGDGALASGTFRRTDPTASGAAEGGFEGVIRLVASTPAIDLSIESSSGVRKDFAGVRSGDVLVLD